MREEEEDPLSPMARVFQSREIDYCAVTMIGFKTKIKPDVVIDALKYNVSKHPRFSSKLVHTYTYLHTDVPLYKHLLSRLIGAFDTIWFRFYFIIYFPENNTI